MTEVPITELEKIEADRVDGVGSPANGIPFLMLKSLPDQATKDWAEWDAANEGGGSRSQAGAASAVAEAKTTHAQEQKGGKGKPTAAQLHNAHEVHEAHEEHEGHLHAEHETHVGHTEHETAEEHAAAVRAERGQTHPASSSAPKLTAQERAASVSQQETKAEQVMRNQKSAGGRNCPKCDATFDADHKGNTCPNCGADLPAADDAAKMAATRELVKAIVARKVDEAPDIAGGTAVIAQIADLIIAEAQELKAGNTGEISDIQQLACAAEMIWTWRTGEESVASGSVMPATALMQSAMAKDRDYSAAERKEMAGDGRALPDGSYPIADEHDLNSAAILARSGHGDVSAATKHIGKRAKELGVANPLDNDTAKSAAREVAEDATAVNTETQVNEGISIDAFKAAVTKAMAPIEEQVNLLKSELAKVKATPIPGGPMMNVSRQAPKAADGEDWAAKAAYFRAMADTVSSDPNAADGYRQLARQADDKANATA